MKGLITSLQSSVCCNVPAITWTEFHWHLRLLFLLTVVPTHCLLCPHCLICPPQCMPLLYWAGPSFTLPFFGQVQLGHLSISCPIQGLHAMPRAFFCERRPVWETVPLWKDFSSQIILLHLGMAQREGLKSPSSTSMKEGPRWYSSDVWCNGGSNAGRIGPAAMDRWAIKRAEIGGTLGYSDTIFSIKHGVLLDQLCGWRCRKMVVHLLKFRTISKKWNYKIILNLMEAVPLYSAQFQYPPDILFLTSISLNVVYGNMRATYGRAPECLFTIYLKPLAKIIGMVPSSISTCHLYQVRFYKQKITI